MRIMLNGTLIFLIWAVFCRYWYVCKIKHHCGEEAPATEQVEPSARAQDLGLFQGDQLVFGGFEQLGFGGDGTQPELTVNNGLFLDSLAAWFRHNASEGLTLAGAFLASEDGQTSGFFENLGLARAAAIRQALVDRGLDESRIGLDYERLEGDDLSHPVRFSVRTASPTAEAAPGEAPVANAADAFTFTNMNFSGANFDRNSDVFQPNATFTAYADSLKTYFTLHPDKSLTITGHTDALSSDAYNLDLGRRRAMAVRRFLEQRGVKASVKIASSGEREPIASNDTEAGRAKNRRVNLKIN